MYRSVFSGLLAFLVLVNLLACDAIRLKPVVHRDSWGVSRLNCRKISLPNRSNDQSLRKIAFVNLDRILSESFSAKAAQKKLEKEFKKREEAIKIINIKLSEKKEALSVLIKTQSKLAHSQQNLLDRKKLNNLKKSISLLESKLKKMQSRFKFDLNRRKQEEVVLLIEGAREVIKQLTERLDLDLVVQDAVFASPAVDITDMVLKLLGAKNK